MSDVVTPDARVDAMEAQAPKPCPFVADGRHADVGDVVAERPVFGAVVSTRRCWICGHESTQRWSIQDYREDAAECEFAMEASWLAKEARRASR